MRDLNSAVLKLARDVRSGKLSPEQTKSEIKKLEAEFGDWDMPVALPDQSSMSPAEYLAKLTSMIEAGVFSKEALVQMATIVSDGSNGETSAFKKYKMPIIIGSVVLIVAVVLIIILTGGANTK